MGKGLVIFYGSVDLSNYIYTSIYHGIKQKIPQCDLKPPAKKLEFKIESPGRSGRLRDGTRSLPLHPYSLLKQQIKTDNIKHLIIWHIILCDKT